MKRQRQFMPREVWDCILYRYVVPFRHVNAHLNPPTLIPHKDGEPLLNKQLPDLLRAASEVVPDMHIDIYSHGLLLPKRPGFIDFLGSLPNKVRLLVSFHFYNHDGTLNDYADTTQFFKRLFAGPTPGNIEFIFASHLIPPMTTERLAEWKNGWRAEAAAGRVTVHANVNINPWTGLIDAPGLSHFTGCPYERFDHMFFGATGNIVPCCMDLEEEIIFGNVMYDDPETMFGTVRAFYAAQFRREVNHGLCHNCFGLPPKEKAPDLLQIGGAA
jgi:hypothetical protein